MRISLRLIGAPVLLTPLLLLYPQHDKTISFETPIDAISINMPADIAVINVRAKQKDGWSEWQPLHIENEQDPTLTESNLVMFPEATKVVEVSEAIDGTSIHPITVSHEPVRYQIAATHDPGTPKILSRSEWGADDSLLYVTSRQVETTPEEKDQN